ncbi:MAG: DUF177 domain-containing protein [Pseudomonadota bacterium]
MSDVPDFQAPLLLGDLEDGIVRRTLEPGAAELSALAERLKLPAVKSLRADLEVRRVRKNDVIVKGAFNAVVTRICVASLEAFDESVEDSFSVRLSPHVDRDLDAAREVELDYDSDIVDPLPEEAIDLADYVAQYLALALDPYPRKPGAEALVVPHAAEEEAPTSPFAVLKRLKQDDS